MNGCEWSSEGWSRVWMSVDRLYVTELAKVVEDLLVGIRKCFKGWVSCGLVEGMLVLAGKGTK